MSDSAISKSEAQALVDLESEVYVVSDGEGGVGTVNVTANDMRATLSGRLPANRGKQRQVIGLLLQSKGVNLDTILTTFVDVMRKDPSAKMRMQAGDTLLELIGAKGKVEDAPVVTVNVAPIDTKNQSDEEIRREYQRRMLAAQKGVDLSEVPALKGTPAFEQIVVKEREEGAAPSILVQEEED